MNIMTTNLGNNETAAINTPKGVVKAKPMDVILAALAAEWGCEAVQLKAYLMRFQQANGRLPTNDLAGKIDFEAYLRTVAPSLLAPAGAEKVAESINVKAATPMLDDIPVRTGKVKGAKSLYVDKFDGSAFVDLVRHESNMSTASRNWWITETDAKLYHTLVCSAEARDVATFVATVRAVHKGIFWVRVTQRMIKGDGWQAFVSAVEANGIAIGVPGFDGPRKVGEQKLKATSAGSVQQEVKAAVNEGSYLNTPRPNNVQDGMSAGGGVCNAPFNGKVDLPLLIGWIGEIEGQDVFDAFRPFTNQLRDAVKMEADADTFTEIAKALTMLAYEHGVTSVTLNLGKSKITDAIESALKGKLPRWLQVQADWRERANNTPPRKAARQHWRQICQGRRPCQEEGTWGQRA